MNAYDIILRPVITEQSMADVADKKYVFQVAIDADKTAIKAAIEEIFEVKVAKVTTSMFSPSSKGPFRPMNWASQVFSPHWLPMPGVSKGMSTSISSMAPFISSVNVTLTSPPKPEAEPVRTVPWP